MDGVLVALNGEILFQLFFNNLKIILSIPFLFVVRFKYSQYIIVP